LQLDATSIFLLMLAEMTASGLSIIFTLDEVNFVQNLVYYIGRAYRTPDFGIWERGNKINHGNAELNASSLGMAKAALEAVNGLNLFGVYGSQASVIHVLPDEIARARITLESLLPRESGSKEIDAALLSIISYPAFAVKDDKLRERTFKEIVSKLAGKYGCKRFLRDGHQTVLEDTERLHYEPSELKEFEHIECEWPLFFTYLVLDGLFRGEKTQIEKYQQLLKSLLVEQNGVQLLPELYYVPEENIEAEKINPQTQLRLPNENIPLV
ncbi:MAG: glycoside hydrolase family 15 protein, partial [Dolichospermum sp.]